MFDISVSGADDLAAVARRLKAAGEGGKGLRKALLASIQRSTKGVKEDVKVNWAAEMPHRGGLASRPLRLVTRTRTGGRSVGVRIVSSSRDGYDLGPIDRGSLRHPVFGNKKAWTTQSIPAGTITRPQEESAPAVRLEIIRAIDSINRAVEGN